jgi:hypothetical protein
MGMRTTAQHAHVETKDFSLEGACILCGGNLQVRVTAEGAATVCLACRWVSRPHMQRTDEGIQVTHPAGGIA